MNGTDIEGDDECLIRRLKGEGNLDEAAEYHYRYRRPSTYRPPKKGLPRLIPTRSPEEERHRPDYNNIFYSLEPEDKSWYIKIGGARVSDPKIAFSCNIHANAVTENPYESEEVTPLVGPPFYTLAVRLVVLPARGNVLHIVVPRQFDSAGYLAWIKRPSGLASIGVPPTFCPMADPKSMEERFFGGVSPESEGYFYAMASGSVSDCISRENFEKKMNLWKLFKPYVLELAQRTEVRELEPFRHTGHEELHTDIGGYDESAF
jgi:hypothetical protein